MNLSEEEEYELIFRVLGACGAGAHSAAVQARWLVEADMRGHSSHGIQRLPTLARRMERGLIMPDADPVLSWRSDSVLVVDGARGFGPVVGMHAVEHSLDKVRRSGIVLAAVHNSNHLGILAPYVEALAAEGMIGVALTTSEALVHPFGGRKAMIGTNPLAIAIPADPHPLVLDMATGQVSMGRILHHAQTGEALPPGWAVDETGEPTTDPSAAAAGAISPFGGAKGYGLGLALEVLVATLTATALGLGIRGTLDANRVCSKGDVFISIDSSVLHAGSMLEAVSVYLDAVRATPNQAGASAVRIPGDRARAERGRRRPSGIEIPDRVWRDVLAFAERPEVSMANEDRSGDAGGPVHGRRDRVCESGLLTDGGDAERTQW